MRRLRKRPGTNRGRVSKNDTYVIEQDVEIVDIDGDGVSDLLATHTVTKNDKKFVEAKVAWYGLDDDILEEFVKVLEEEGLMEGEFKTNKLHQVNSIWKKLTNFSKKINHLADVKSQELDE